MTTCFAVGSPSESSSHVSTRRKTEEPPSRPSGGAEGDSPLGCDAEGAAGGPSGPLHGSSAGITRQGSAGAQKAQPNLRHLPTERIDFLFKEQLSEGGKKEGEVAISVFVWLGSCGGLCMHVFCTVRAEKAPKICRDHFSRQSGADGAGAPGEHGGSRGR